jgi:hypothetical protein
MNKFFLTFLVLISFVSLHAQQDYREEFNGPYRSWANVKTRFRAAGDGKKDDTKPIQLALDSLTRNLKSLFNTAPGTRYLVVYLPAGTYRITNTLRLEGRIGVSFIGEDPTNTIIKWDGRDNDTMFFSNRSAYVKFSRITWDANNKKDIEALGIHYKDMVEPFFAPTSIEVSDMIFTGKAKYGISCGSIPGQGTGTMDSEFTIKRCRFLSCTEAGINITGYNALDYWIWDCEFNACKIGVKCAYGNYHLYQSHFYNSTIADIHNTNGYYTSVRGCYSKNAQVFSWDEGAGCNALKRIFQSNVIENCRQTAIQYHHLGKISLTDNQFINTTTSSPSIVEYASWCYTSFDILSVGNRYHGKQPFILRKDYPSKIHSITDLTSSSKAAAVKPVIRPLQPLLPFVKRKVFEVPVNAGSALIQEIINKAALQKGQRPVVHFPMGEYILENTLVIPAGSDMQLVGDGILGASSFIQKTPKNDFYYFNIKGPSYVTIRDLTIGKEGNPEQSNGFLFTGIDQLSSEAYLDQLYSPHTSRSLMIDQLDYTYIEKNNSFFSKGNICIGGRKVRDGKGTSRLYCFGGQSAGTTLQNNATVVAKDCWWEGSFRKDFMPLRLNGWGNLTIDGGMFAPADNDSGSVVQIEQFRGKVTLMNMYLIGSIFARPAQSNLQMLFWNINMYHKKDPTAFLSQKTGAKLAMLGITSQCFKAHDRLCSDENTRTAADKMLNVPDKNKFINELTADNRRALPRSYRNLSPGVSNIFISRVSVLTNNTAFTFRQ